MKEKVIVRMPPSPTGPLHLGTARTMLFNYLFAKTKEGDFIFRWEDTDKARSEARFEKEILEGLEWLGIPVQKEAKKIDRQSAHITHHQEALQKLWEKGVVFPCFTPPEDIQSLREEAAKKKENFVFWSPDRDLSRDIQEQRMKETSFVWRFKTPKGRTITFKDAVRGEISVPTDTLGDFVVAKPDQVLYLLANVVDDALDGVTHIIRGEDHISNTPKQILIWEALGETPPTYAHIPLVLDRQRRKLSKRNVPEGVCVLIKDFQQAGFLPEAVLNGLAFLGWHPKDTTQEVFSLPELIERFALEKINAAAAQYDFEKMQWFNQQWMKRLDIETLIAHALWYGERFFPDQYAQYTQDLEKWHRIVAALRAKAPSLKSLWEEPHYFFQYELPPKSLFLHEKFQVDTSTALRVLRLSQHFFEALPPSQYEAAAIKSGIVEIIQQEGFSNGQFLWPLRVALSGREKSCGPFDIAAILGKSETLNRLSACIKHLETSS